MLESSMGLIQSELNLTHDKYNLRRDRDIRPEWTTETDTVSMCNSWGDRAIVKVMSLHPRLRGYFSSSIYIYAFRYSSLTDFQRLEGQIISCVFLPFLV